MDNQWKMVNGQWKITVMKFLTYLQKTKMIWWLIGLCTLFAILRLPSLVEPYWYGDEGIYHVIGQALTNGQLLYRDIWDNKPPMLYLVYALLQSDQTAIRAFSLVVGLLAIISFFFLSTKLFHSIRISSSITLLFAVLFGTPIIEGNIANAENFMLPLIITAALIIFHVVNTKHLSIHRSQLPIFSVGLLLGIAFLFKTVAVFEFSAFFLFLIIIYFQTTSPKSSLKKFLKQYALVLGLYVIGFVLPILLTTLYFISQNAATAFIQAVFFGNVDYVGFENSLFGIPQGLLIFKVVLLMSTLVILFIRRNHLSQRALFILLWLVFALFSTSFSGRPYTHYLLMSLPAFCLLLGLIPVTKNVHFKVGLTSLAIIIVLTAHQYRLDTVKSVMYYQNFVSFITGTKSVSAYQAFFDSQTPRDYTVASFITSHTTPEDQIFIWGDHPQIYVLADKLPPYKYTVAYHVKPSTELLQETQEAIEQTNPRYIIILDEAQPLPFAIPLYIMRYKVEGATIYERSY